MRGSFSVVKVDRWDIFGMAGQMLPMDARNTKIGGVVHGPFCWENTAALAFKSDFIQKKITSALEPLNLIHRILKLSY